MGNELKAKILEYNGITTENQMQNKPSVLSCSRCSLSNAVDNKLCSQCGYPLTAGAYDEIKVNEDMKLRAMEMKYEQDMKAMREEIKQEMKSQIAQLLTNLKPEILKDGLS